MRKYKLTILELLPAQYRIPIYKKLSTHPKINLKVLFCSNISMKNKKIPGFGGAETRWISSLNGFDYKFLKNFYPLNKDNPPRRLWNFGILGELIVNRPDAIIIYGYQSTAHKISLIAAKILRIPIIFREEIDFVDESRPINKKLKQVLFPLLFKLPSAFLYSYTRSMEFYKHYGVPERKLFFHPCSVDNNFFQNQAKRMKKDKSRLKKEFGIDEKTNVISYVGRFSERKRPLDILYAYNGMKHKEKYSLIFIGGGVLRGKMERYAKKNKLKNVHFIDFIKYQNISKAYAISDLFVIPSSYDPSPKAMNEAMNFSIPIIASENVGTAQDLIKNGKNGYIIKLGDIENLASKMEKIISNSSLQNKMGKESLKIVSKWNIKENVSATIEALDYIYKNG